MVLNNYAEPDDAQTGTQDRAQDTQSVYDTTRAADDADVDATPMSTASHQGHADFDTSEFESQFENMGVHSTPHYEVKRGRAVDPSPVPSTGRHSGSRIPRRSVSASEDPSTPRPANARPVRQAEHDSSPFEPLPSRQIGTAQRNQDPLLHRILDQNYRLQATPLTTRAHYAPATSTKTALPTAFESSPMSSPEIPKLDLHTNLFSAKKTRPKASAAPGFSAAQRKRFDEAPRTPGMSVQHILSQPDVHRNADGTTFMTRADASASRGVTHTATHIPHRHLAGSSTAATSANVYDSDSEDDTQGSLLNGMSPPKTIHFGSLMQDARNEAIASEILDSSPSLAPTLNSRRNTQTGPRPLDDEVNKKEGRGRVLRTPAREASRKIIDDLVLTAGGAARSGKEGSRGRDKDSLGLDLDLDLDLSLDLEADADDTEMGAADVNSPSLVRKAAFNEDDTF